MITVVSFLMITAMSGLTLTMADKEINNITSAKVKEICKERLSMIEQGKRDFRF